LPLYEYRCKQCGHQFEKIQSFSAPDEKECPVCKGELERLISASAIQFKGAGWYVNDYAGKGGAKKADGAADAPAAGSDTSAAKESKTETKSSDGGATSAPAAPTAAPAAASTTASSSPTS
jgi:putative FmdB family regulatory protein